MIFVIVEEAISEANAEGNTDIATLGAMVRFCYYDDSGCGSGLENFDL